MFGKAAESVGNQSMASGKVDERTSLLPDGTTRGPDKGAADSAAKPDDKGAGSKLEEENDPKKEDEESKEDQPLTHAQILKIREETIDSALISAVKTLAQLQRAQDLMAY